MSFSRRQFLLGVGAAAITTQLSASATTSRAEMMEYSIFNLPSSASAEFNIAYHAITWGDDFNQAITDISALGYCGLQMRSDDYKLYPDRASEFKDLLAAKQLTLVSISTGGVSVKPETERKMWHGLLVRD